MQDEQLSIKTIKSRFFGIPIYFRNHKIFDVDWVGIIDRFTKLNTSLSDMIFNLKSFKDKSVNNEDEATWARAYVLELVEVSLNIPTSYGKALKYLMLWKKMTVEELSEQTLLAPETISRMRNRNVSKPNLKSVVAICVGLELPTHLSHKLIELAGHSLRLTIIDHQFYELILNSCTAESIYYCNEILLSNQLKPLTVEK
ncbi:helix-turn-helix domain-containing protein [Pseudolactococcus reticulitermitis]